jgi:hypothetical protein
MLTAAVHFVLSSFCFVFGKEACVMSKNDKGGIHTVHIRSLVNFKRERLQNEEKKEPGYEYILRQTKVET